MLPSTILVLASAALSTAHTVITYPGWRGDNLVTNATYPYGMQWMYPCGGMNMTQNRTYWSTSGGAIAFQPGWFQGHQTATLYVNLGIGNLGPDGGPLNMSLSMTPAFGIAGPSKNPYPGTVCLPQVSLPQGYVPQVGENATIQVVELALHGAALFSCVDITFVAPGDPLLEKVNDVNCFNSSDIDFTDIYTTRVVNSNLTASSTGFASLRPSAIGWYAGYIPLIIGGAWAFI